MRTLEKLMWLAISAVLPLAVLPEALAAPQSVLYRTPDHLTAHQTADQEDAARVPHEMVLPALKVLIAQSKPGTGAASKAPAATKPVDAKSADSKAAAPAKTAAADTKATSAASQGTTSVRGAGSGGATTAAPASSATNPRAPRSNLSPVKGLDPAVEQSLNGGIALFNKGKYQESLVPLQKAMELQPNNTGVRNWVGATFMQLKKFDEASKIYEEVVRMDPDYAEGHNNLAYCYQQLNQFDKAEPEYREAIRLKPDFKEAHFNLAYVLVELKKSEDAIKEFETVLKLDPTYADAYFQIGKMYLQLKNYDKANEWYDKAIAKDKKNIAALTDKAIILKEKGDRAGAKEQMEKVLDINSQYYDANLELGVMALDDKDYTASLQFLAKALEANPYHPAVHFHLGRYYYGLDQMKNAIKQFQDCLKCQKDFPGGEDWLAKSVQKQKGF